MKEVIITKYGPPEVLKVREKPTPVPQGGEVLIKNHFTGINFSEIYCVRHPCFSFAFACSLGVSMILHHFAKFANGEDDKDDKGVTVRACKFIQFSGLLFLLRGKSHSIIQAQILK